MAQSSASSNLSLTSMESTSQHNAAVSADAVSADFDQNLHARTFYKSGYLKRAKIVKRAHRCKTCREC